MSISRSPKDPEHPYTRASNSFIYDSRLSLKSKALLLFVLSKPPTWVFNFRDVLRFCSDGIKSVRNSIKELSSLGYLFVRQDHLPNGHWDYSSYYFFETFTNISTIITITQPHRPFRHAVKPHAVKPHAQNSNTPNNKNKKLLEETTTTTSTKVVNTKADVVDLISPEEKQKRIEFLNSFAFINLKSLIKKYSLHGLYTNAKIYESQIRNADNSTAYLVCSIKENWSKHDLKSNNPKLHRITCLCSICKKYFYYLSYGEKYTECLKHRKKKIN